MAITHRRLLLLVGVWVGLLAQPVSLWSCGPFFARAAFTYTVHPDFPLEAFAAGALGVLQPTYARSYLAVAYRYLTGMRFTAAEQKALIALWRTRLVSSMEEGPAAPETVWLEARSKVPGASPLTHLDVFRRLGEFRSYLNCPADAFSTAVSTLQRLQAQFGPESPAVRAWLQDQDVVFAKCADGAGLSVRPTTEPPLRADNAYQMAAAHFYSGAFEAAVEAFDAIAQDTASPWRGLAPYLAARALVRQAMLGAGDDKVDTTLLERAAIRVRAILDDRAQQARHPAARRLLQFIRFRTAPTALLHELSQAMRTPEPHTTLQEHLREYTLLLDKHLGGSTETREPVTTARAKALWDDPMSDWIATFQATDPEALAHALARWEQTAALPWLVAVLSKLEATHAKTAALLSAAAQVPTTSPAFASVAFHRARVLLAAGQIDAARTYLDTVIAPAKDTLPVSATNFLRAVRMQVARNLEEFVTYAQRWPSGITYDEDGRELPPRLFDVVLGDMDDALPATAMQAHFDADATSLLNEALPLSLRQEAAQRPALAPHLQRELALTTWVEAALLGQVSVAQALAPSVATHVPVLTPYLDAYLAAPTNEARTFAAVFLLLHYPGTRPYIDEGVGRLTPLDKIDNFRNNWWCALPKADGESKPSTETQPANPIAAMLRTPHALDFLSAAHQTAAQTERQQLRALATAPNYLATQVLAWGKRAPDDPRVPEALHLVVRATRYGCTDNQTTQFSKQAYQMLHKQYPKSSWAQQTKYWY